MTALRMPPRFNADLSVGDGADSSEDMISGLLPAIGATTTWKVRREPLGDDDLFVVAVTDGSRHRFFRTRTGLRLVEITASEFSRWVCARLPRELTSAEADSLGGSHLGRGIAKGGTLDLRWAALFPHRANEAVWRD